jgi:uncharacterized protein YndB with AHSA1/START domain
MTTTQPTSPRNHTTGTSDRVEDFDTLVITRRLPASPERVFAAFTRPELARQWMAPGELSVSEVEIDARVGGSYRIIMAGADKESYSPSGVYEEIVPNQILVYTWKWAHEDLVTRVTIELRDLGTGETELTLTHSGFTDTEMRESHEEGWKGCFLKLAETVA